jgi:hypothetical protein
LEFPTVAEQLAAAIARFRACGYLEQAFGGYCVDAGEVEGSLGSDPNVYFLQATGRRDIWPYDATIAAPGAVFPEDQPSVPRWSLWDEDTWFDVLEALHDLVSKPTDGWYHDFSGCGWHYSEFEAPAGQSEFRDEISYVLRMGEPAYEMNGEGEIVAATPEEFRDLVEASFPEGTEHDEVEAKVAVAIRSFRARGATKADRQHAVRDLADVLEHLRADMKTVMLSADENDLFNIANNFGIRHNNRVQRRDYDDATWLRWMFYVYLATIHAVLRIRARPN